ncbi:MAG TPA: RNA polymerase subunit sigma-24 [Verrucomicrobiae bacterium]|nr:RNA polymerase subunit sigma-24 [Verrucomicrobiae bacterium]
MQSDSAPPRQTATFPATRWSVVAAAGTKDGRASLALAELCQLYWYPLYAYARRRGLSPEDAEDATQRFFTTILERNFFADADPAKGRLRSFLLKAFAFDLADANRQARRLKRGGAAEMVSFDRELAEDRYQGEREITEPASQFDLAWATTVLEGAVRTVEEQYHTSGRGALFDALRPCLGNSPRETPEKIPAAASLGLSEVALRQAISRLRDRFRTALRAQIADTLREPTEEAINEELRGLREALVATQ